MGAISIVDWPWKCPWDLQCPLRLKEFTVGYISNRKSLVFGVSCQVPNCRIQIWTWVQCGLCTTILLITATNLGYVPYRKYIIPTVSAPSQNSFTVLNVQIPSTTSRNISHNKIMLCHFKCFPIALIGGILAISSTDPIPCKVNARLMMQQPICSSLMNSFPPSLWLLHWIMWIDGPNN